MFVTFFKHIFYPSVNRYDERGRVDLAFSTLYRSYILEGFSYKGLDFNIDRAQFISQGLS